MREKLTKAVLARIQAQGGEAFVLDSQVSGLAVRKYPSGAAPYIVQYRTRGEGVSRRVT